MAECTVLTCFATAHARGLCSNHYTLARHGEVVDRFGSPIEMLAHVDARSGPWCSCPRPSWRVTFYGLAHECQRCGRGPRPGVAVAGLVALTPGQSLAVAIVVALALVVVVFGRVLDHRVYDDDRSNRKLLAELRRHDDEVEP